jgi:predicted dienelactone hydrolase
MCDRRRDWQRAWKGIGLESRSRNRRRVCTPCRPTFAANVGFEEIKIANGAEAPLTGGVWYPTDAPETEQSLGDIAQDVAPLAAVAGRDLPLVVLSHGGGGGYDSHCDTALAWPTQVSWYAAVSHQGTPTMTRAKS